MTVTLSDHLKMEIVSGTMIDWNTGEVEYSSTPIASIVGPISNSVTYLPVDPENENLVFGYRLLANPIDYVANDKCNIAVSNTTKDLETQEEHTEEFDSSEFGDIPLANNGVFTSEIVDPNSNGYLFGLEYDSVSSVVTATSYKAVYKMTYEVSPYIETFSVTRNGVQLENNSDIYQGDILRIQATSQNSMVMAINDETVLSLVYSIDYQYTVGSNVHISIDAR